jgi:hypothetical protein
MILFFISFVKLSTVLIRQKRRHVLGTFGFLFAARSQLMSVYRESDKGEDPAGDSEDVIDLQDSMVLLNEHATPSLHSLVYDILFRPTALDNIPMWDQCVLYEKVRINKGKKCLQDDNDMEQEEDNDDSGSLHK